MVIEPVVNVWWIISFFSSCNFYVLSHFVIDSPYALSVKTLGALLALGYLFPINQFPKTYFNPHLLFNRRNQFTLHQHLETEKFIIFWHENTFSKSSKSQRTKILRDTKGKNWDTKQRPSPVLCVLMNTALFSWPQSPFSACWHLFGISSCCKLQFYSTLSHSVYVAWWLTKIITWGTKSMNRGMRGDGSRGRWLKQKLNTD